MKWFIEDPLRKMNFAGFLCVWFVFASLDLFNGVLLYGVTFRGFALADTFRALLIDLLLAAPVAFLGRKYYKFYAIPVFLFLLAASLGSSFHILTYQAGISTYAVFSIIETTGPESVEFFADQVSFPKVLIVLSSLMLSVLLYFRVLRRRVLDGKRYVPVLGCVLLIVSCFVGKTAIEQGGAISQFSFGLYDSGELAAILERGFEVDAAKGRFS